MQYRRCMKRPMKHCSASECGGTVVGHGLCSKHWQEAKRRCLGIQQKGVGMKSDNRPENLELWSKSQPSGQRVSDKVTWAIELLLLYAPEKLRPAMLDDEHVPYDGFLSSEWLS